MIGVIAYPYRHFLAPFKHGSFYQKRLEFNGLEFTILGFYYFFTQVFDVEIKIFIIQKHGKWDLVIFFVSVKINISGIID